MPPVHFKHFAEKAITKLLMLECCIDEIISTFSIAAI